jgi:hypothetical protein
MKTLCCFCWSVAMLAAATVAWAAAPGAKPEKAPKPDADGWYSLFNGKDLSGWKKSEDNPDTFQVVDGEIVVKGPVCHLYYAGPVQDANFKNFEWKCDVMTKPHANSGMYFHTKYQETGFPKIGIEVQVNNTHGDPVKTGSLYHLKKIMNNSPAKDDEWFTQTVIVKGKHVTVKVNDKVVNEYTEPEDPKQRLGSAGEVIASGTFALQGHDPGSEIHYRKIMVKPLP